MQDKLDTVKQIIQDAIDTTKPDPNAFGTVAHAAAMEQQKQGQQEVKHLTRVRTAKSVVAQQNYEKGAHTASLKTRAREPEGNNRNER